MSDLIRRKQPGEAWETAVDTGGGGSQPSVLAVTHALAFSNDSGMAWYTLVWDDGSATPGHVLA
jgi:hypothetical protein